MSYYRGDYYRGDYYRGDPGILGFLGSAVKTVAKGAIGFATGGVGGAIGAITGAAQRPAQNLPALSGGPNLPALPPAGGTPVVMGQGTAVVGVSPLGTLGVRGVGKGYHLNRSTYYTRQGRVEKGTKLVRNRHTNYGNSRALVRSLRRAHGFARLARHVMSFEITGKRHKAGHFKARRRAHR